MLQLNAVGAGAGPEWADYRQRPGSSVLVVAVSLRPPEGGSFGAGRMPVGNDVIVLGHVRRRGGWRVFVLMLLAPTRSGTFRAPRQPFGTRSTSFSSGTSLSSLPVGRTPQPRKRRSSTRAWQRRRRYRYAARLRGLGAGRSRTQRGCETSDAGSSLPGSIRSNSASADCCNSSMVGSSAARAAARAAARPVSVRARRISIAAASPAISSLMAVARSQASLRTPINAAAHAGLPVELQATSRAAPRPAACGTQATAPAGPSVAAQAARDSRLVLPSATIAIFRSGIPMTGDSVVSLVVECGKPAASSQVGAYTRISQSRAIHDRVSSRPSSAVPIVPRDTAAGAAAVRPPRVIQRPAEGTQYWTDAIGLVAVWLARQVADPLHRASSLRRVGVRPASECVPRHLALPDGGHAAIGT